MTKQQHRVFWRLLSYLKPYRLLTLLALALLLGTTVVKSYIPLLASHFIDDYIKLGRLNGSHILALYFGLYLVQTLLQYLGSYYGF